MSYGVKPRQGGTPKAVPCVIGIALMVGIYCVLVPAGTSPVAPVRSAAEASSDVVDEPAAADTTAPPQALRRDGTELRIRNGQPPVVPGWADGLPENSVRHRERIEALSKGHLPADWDSVDRAWAEDEILEEQKSGNPPPVGWDRHTSPSEEAAELVAS